MTPRIENENGVFEYDVNARRWLCLRGHVPGMGNGTHANRFVHLAYGQTLSSTASEIGFTKEDFGFSEPKPKKVRVAGGRRAKPSERKGVKVLIDLSV